ncbi:MAG TPA: efflux RND transporter periplasmic adaptor subunit [Candidatus Krumholzibacteria bacterium]
MKHIRSWLIAGLVLVVLVAGKFAMDSGRPAVSARGGGRPGGGAGGATPVKVTVLASEKLADRITSVGTILANERVDVRSEISGRVVAIPFKEGERVKKGALLVKIDDSELRARLARSQSELDIAKKEAARQEELFRGKVASQREYDSAESNLSVAQAEHDLILAQIAKTDIRAPFGGMVGLRSVSEGGYVTPTTPITTLLDDHPVKIDFTVPERFAGNVKKGDVIHFTVEGNRRVFDGTVYALESNIDPETRTLGVRATSPNTDGALVPGAFAEVDVLMPERQAVTVPAFALVPELGGQKVFLFRGGKAEARPVKTGLRTEERVEIVDGVSAGDTLITSGILQLKTGAPVTLATE